MADWSIYPPKPLPAESAGSRSGILTQFHKMTERRFSKEKTRVFPQFSNNRVVGCFDNRLNHAKFGQNV
jgi:hypothetical protein